MTSTLFKIRHTDSSHFLNGHRLLGPTPSFLHQAHHFYPFFINNCRTISPPLPPSLHDSFYSITKIGRGQLLRYPFHHASALKTSSFITFIASPDYLLLSHPTFNLHLNLRLGREKKVVRLIEMPPVQICLPFSRFHLMGSGPKTEKNLFRSYFFEHG